MLEDALSLSAQEKHPPKQTESDAFELSPGATPSLCASLTPPLRSSLLYPNLAHHAGGIEIRHEGEPAGLSAKLPSASIKLEGLLYALKAVGAVNRKRNASAAPQTVLAPALMLPGRRTALSVFQNKSAAAVTTGEPADLVDVPLWRYAALMLARQCGVDVMPASLIKHPDGRALVVDRFDRRIGSTGSELALAPAFTLSAAALIRPANPLHAAGGSMGAPVTYLGLADILNREGAEPKRDLARLWKRMAFAALLGIPERAKRWQFIRDDDPNAGWHNGWRLAPAHVFAVDEAATDAGPMLTVDGRRPLTSPEDCVPIAGYFAMSTIDAKMEIFSMRKALRDWRSLAESLGASGQEMNWMSRVFDPK